MTFEWAELDELVGGLPRSAYDHTAFWTGDRPWWRGFTTTAVKVGESVTFVRRAHTDPWRRPTGVVPNARAAGSTVDLVLVGCVKQKLNTAAAAKDLYTSALYRKGRTYAEHTGAPWFILSAEHGLVDPDQTLHPYDLRLSKMSREYRRAWGTRVVEQLHATVGKIDGWTIEIHAGAAYTDAVRELLGDRGATVIEPLAGLTIGSRLSWYTPADEPSGKSAPSRAPNSSVASLVDSLSRAEDAIAPARFLATEGRGLRSPGLYSWWVDEYGASDLSTGLGQPVEVGLIYAGLAGATRSRIGLKSKNTLWGRIRTMHLGGRHEFSTFRLSLGSVLAETRGEDKMDEATLTAWMHKHLRIVAVPVADADTLGDVETDVLAILNPPLNLDKVPRDAMRIQLSSLRKKHRKPRRRSASD